MPSRQQCEPEKFGGVLMALALAVAVALVWLTLSRNRLTTKTRWATAQWCAFPSQRRLIEIS